MPAGDTGELTSPAESQRDGAEDGEELIAAGQRAVVTLVRVAPHTVNGVDRVWLAESVLERNADVVVEMVHITMLHIQIFFTHDELRCGSGIRIRNTGISFQRMPGARNDTDPNTRSVIFSQIQRVKR